MIIKNLTADYDTFLSRAQTDENGNRFNPIRLDRLEATDEKSVGTRLQEIAEKATTGGVYTRIGELYGFPICVVSEPKLKDVVASIQNRFVVEGNYKYSYNNGFIAMADTHAAATNFLNALERIPKTIAQYKEKVEQAEKDIPVLREIAGRTGAKRMS